MPVLKNPKHERFAQELAKGASQTEAYSRAGYTPSEQHASRLARNGKVWARVAEILSRGAERAAVTIESLILEAEEARALAMKIDQPSAAVSALTAKAKLAGLWIEKSERTNRYVDPDSLSDDEIISRLRTIGGGVAPLPAEAEDHPQITH